MASISNLKDGEKRIQFVAQDGSRKTIYLGKASMKVAETVKIRVEHLIAARAAGVALDAQTAGWLAGLPDAMHVKLVKSDLAEPRAKRQAIGLGGFVRKLIDGWTDAKPATREVWKQSLKSLAACFGDERDLQSITPSDADLVRSFLAEQKLSPATIAKRLRNARAFLKAAVRQRLIAANPFDGVSYAASVRNHKLFITREMTEEILKHCPNHDWRMVVLLCRFGGLRCPSEVLLLRWQDVDWEHQRLAVQSPKLEHVEGNGVRVIPMFPELAGPLQEQFELAPVGAIYVIDEKYRQSAIGKRQAWMAELQHANDLLQDRATSGAKALAKAVQCTPRQSSHRIGSRVPIPCGNGMARTFAGNRPVSLLANDRRTLRQSREPTARTNNAESNAAGGGNGSNSLASPTRR